jgi:hypothetical protein
MTEHRLPSDGPATVTLVDWCGPQRQVTYKWSAEVVGDLRKMWARARASYRGGLPVPPARAKLTSSGFFAEAYVRANLMRAAWLGSVSSAHTGSPAARAYKQMAFVWPVRLIQQVEDDFDQLDADSLTLWGPRFRLTRAHMVLAAIQYGLKDHGAWLHAVPNDPRLTQARGGKVGARR